MTKLPVWFTTPLGQRFFVPGLLLVPVAGAWGAVLMDVMHVPMVHSQAVDFLWRAIMIASAILGGVVADQISDIQKLSTCSVLPNARSRHLTYLAAFAALPVFAGLLLLLPVTGMAMSLAGAALALSCFSLAAVSTDRCLPPGHWLAAFAALLFLLFGSHYVQQSVTLAPWLAAVPLALATAFLWHTQMSAAFSRDRSLGRKTTDYRSGAFREGGARAEQAEKSQHHQFSEFALTGRSALRDWVSAAIYDSAMRPARQFALVATGTLVLLAVFVGLVSEDTGMLANFAFVLHWAQAPGLRGTLGFPPRNQRAATRFVLSLRSNMLFAAAFLVAVLAAAGLLTRAASIITNPSTIASGWNVLVNALWCMAGVMVAAPLPQLCGLKFPLRGALHPRQGGFSLLGAGAVFGLMLLFVVVVAALPLLLRNHPQLQHPPFAVTAWLVLLLISQALHYGILKRHFARADLI